MITNTKNQFEIRAIINRANGNVEDLGIIARTKLSLYERIIRRLIKWLQ